MRHYYLTSSVGSGSTELNSFDDALYCSKVANYNLVKVSSILPAFAINSSSIDLAEGEILHTAYAQKTTHKHGETISAAIAVGIPMDTKNIGVITEFSGECSLEVAQKKVSAMVVEAMNKRGYDIKDIVCEAVEAIGDGVQYKTVFAALAMW